MQALSKEDGAHAGLAVIHFDEQLLILDKPAGLLAVPGRGLDKQDCLSARAQAVWPDALVVHRLDMATSGLFAMARGLAAQRRLSRSFELREVEKRYLAVVAGRLDAADTDGGWSEIDLPLGPDWPNRPLQQVDRESGRASLTRWRVIAHGPDSTRVELEPLTGRSHQLRVHMQAIGHPILGDPLYGTAEVQAMAPRLLLHATFLALPHPTTGERLSFESPAPF